VPGSQPPPGSIIASAPSIGRELVEEVARDRAGALAA
jgi:hypothetical protein